MQWEKLSECLSMLFWGNTCIRVPIKIMLFLVYLKDIAIFVFFLHVKITRSWQQSATNCFGKRNHEKIAKNNCVKSVRIRSTSDKRNFKYGHFSRSEYHYTNTKQRAVLRKVKSYYQILSKIFFGWKFLLKTLVCTFDYNGIKFAWNVLFWSYSYPKSFLFQDKFSSFCKKNPKICEAANQKPKAISKIMNYKLNKSRIHLRSIINDISNIKRSNRQELLRLKDLKKIMRRYVK